MNISQWYFMGHRVLSLSVVGSTFLLRLYLLRKYPLHIRGMMTMSLCSLGHTFYEVVFCFLTSWYDAWPLYALLSIGVMAVISIIDTYYPYITVSKRFATVFGMWIGSITCLYVTGFYTDVSNWSMGLAPDPHGWLWAVNKALGFGMWLLLIPNSRGVK